MAAVPVSISEYLSIVRRKKTLIGLGNTFVLALRIGNCTLQHDLVWARFCRELWRMVRFNRSMNEVFNVEQSFETSSSIRGDGPPYFAR